MAERSKAAVDVAAERSSKDPQPTTDGGAPRDAGSAVSRETANPDTPVEDPDTEPAASEDAPRDAGTAPADEADDDASDTEAEEEKPEPEQSAESEEPNESEDAPGEPGPPALKPGDTLADRYRLEECLGSNDCYSTWRAVDEKLRRAVGVHLLSAGHPRADRTIAAARSAALLADPRFIHVLDAVRDGDTVYLVREWLPDATDLGTLLAEEPLEPYEAHQLARQVSAALSAAHRAGLSHLCLDPTAVLRTDSGQYRISGLAVDAALRGIDAAALPTAEKQVDDTRAIGSLLHAALCRHWPAAGGAHGLPGVPASRTGAPPDQLHPGANQPLSEIAVRALAAGRTDALPHHEEPLSTPAELSAAVSAMPKIRPPEPEPASVPARPASGAAAERPAADGRKPGRKTPERRPAGSGNGPRRPAAAGPSAAAAGRTGRAVRAVATLVVLVALGLGSWELARTIAHPGGSGNHATDDSAHRGGSGSGTPIHPRNLPIAQGTEFSPLGGAIKGEDAGKAVDGNTGTAWITSHFFGHANFGNLGNRKEGSGIVVDLGKVRTVTEVKVDMWRDGGAAEVLAAPSNTGDPTRLADFSQRLTGLGRPHSVVDAKPDKPVKTRYVLVHITELPPDAGGYRGGISEIHVLGQ